MFRPSSFWTVDVLLSLCRISKILSRELIKNEITWRFISPRGITRLILVNTVVFVGWNWIVSSSNDFHINLSKLFIFDPLRNFWIARNYSSVKFWSLKSSKTFILKYLSRIIRISYRIICWNYRSHYCLRHPVEIVLRTQKHERENATISIEENFSVAASSWFKNEFVLEHFKKKNKMGGILVHFKVPPVRSLQLFLFLKIFWCGLNFSGCDHSRSFFEIMTELIPNYFEWFGINSGKSQIDYFYIFEMIHLIWSSYKWFMIRPSRIRPHRSALIPIYIIFKTYLRNVLF